MGLGVRRAFSLALVVALAATACSDDDGSVLEDAAVTTSTADRGSTDESATSTSEAQGTTTTTLSSFEQTFEYLTTTEFDPGDDPLTGVGPPDFPTAEAITAELEETGVPLAGLEIWVFPVIGSDEKLLVLEINASVAEEAGGGADSASEQALEGDFLSSAPSIQEAGITRIVMNLYDSDDEGPFVMTITLPYDAWVASSTDGADVSDSVAMQIERLSEPGGPPPPTPVPTTPTSSTTQATTTTTIEAGLLLEDSFVGSTELEPLFGPTVMSTIVTADEQLDMRVFTTGVIPAMYPEPLPAAVDITFDFNPMPTDGSTAAFGAVVLSEDPSDGALEHYVAIWANPSDGLLTIIPWDDGWGAGVSETIPGSIGFGAGEWVTMRLVVVSGSIDAYLDGVLVASWSGTTPVTSGWWGPVVAAAAAGDGMFVDDVRVKEAG